MPIVMPSEKPRELCPAGSHVATCYRVVDLGTQQDSGFGAKPRIYIAWELPHESMADGRPFTIGRTYNYSSNRKSSLRSDVERWLGRALTASDFGIFDLGSLLGAACTLGVKHSANAEGRVYANVVSVMLPPRGTPRLPLVNDGITFSLADRPFDQHGLDALPEWLQGLITKSPEYQEALHPGTTAQRLAAVWGPNPDAAPDDNIPF
jgi:hypothetical protein